MIEQTQPVDEEIGIVKSVEGFLAFIEGLPTIKINDFLESENGAKALVSALYPKETVVNIVSDNTVKAGDIFRKSKEHLTIEVGEYMFGRTINPLGIPIDGKKMLTNNGKQLSMENPAHGIYHRQFIKDQFITGITLIDMLVPIGKGQRELILGDARSGKTSFVTDLIVNQKNTGVICIYASVGKTITDVKKMMDILDANKAKKNTIIVAASPNDPPPLIFLAPKTAMTIAEFFQQKGMDVLVILDDMGNHAKIYREMSLLARKTPGRESYPGDIFYQHAHLLERAGNFKKTVGGGSITALPVMEINLGDFTGFIPTNLMSMTDGHLLFTAGLHNQGMRPAIDLGLSVTRVGLRTQNKLQNAIAQKIKTAITSVGQLESISRLSTELPEETQLVLRQKDLIDELIIQESFVSYPLATQLLSLALVFTSFLKDKDKYFLRIYKKQLLDNFSTNDAFVSLREMIQNDSITEDKLVETLETLKPVMEGICSVSEK